MMGCAEDNPRCLAIAAEKAELVTYSPPTDPTPVPPPAWPPPFENKVGPSPEEK